LVVLRGCDTMPQGRVSTSTTIAALRPSYVAGMISTCVRGSKPILIGRFTV
jgi:hypothetical protein